jgi:hypothetical protein
MNLKLREAIRRLWRAELFSPAGFVQRALVISALFLLVHLAGLREYTSILNGTVGPDSAGWAGSAFLGMTYIILYLAFVILAPMLILAAGLLAVWQRLIRRKDRRVQTAKPPNPAPAR